MREILINSIFYAIQIYLSELASYSKHLRLHVHCVVRAFAYVLSGHTRIYETKISYTPIENVITYGTTMSVPYFEV